MLSRLTRVLILVALLGAAQQTNSVAQVGGSLVGVNESGAGTDQIVRIDASTGARSVLATTPAGQAILFNGIAAIDAIGQRYFLITIQGGARRLLSVNIQTGAILSNPLLGYNGAFLQYDSTSGQLIGVDETGPSPTVVSISPTTGLKTSIATVPIGQNLLANGLAAIDVAGRRYFLVTTTGGAQRLLVIDMVSGAILANPAVGFLPQLLTYDGVSATLIGVEETGPPSGKFIVSIDPSTGGRSIVATIPSGQAVLLNGGAALDQAGRRFFITTTVPGARCLLAVNIQTGTIVANPGLGYNGALLQFDAQQGFSSPSSLACATPPTPTLTPTTTATLTSTQVATATGTATPTGTLQAATATIVIERSGGAQASGDDVSRPRTAEQRRQKEHTNQGSRDDDYVEGDVVVARCDAPIPAVVIANRDGLVEVQVLGGAAVCRSVRIGDYLSADGVKQHEALFEAEDISVERRR